ncbi:glycine cleavage system protein GcvH [uncultured Pseudokineococcus sp.]|uniref:glycine cleavage system protein GcvH n=1 Tax=uncultured Pseudokineococcus sp. TaxID=1642928 RepID=UPI002625FDCF|nr:glycine cleavage system protein GcvH [uncultured Pseudokineococcus sp.]
MADDTPSEGTSELPSALRYTAEHEWVRPPDADGVVRVGITAYAQDALGDVVFVQLPDAGSSVEAGASIGEVESTKSVSEVYAPLTGVVRAVNEALEANPELVNSAPYGEGWMFELEGVDAAAVDALLDARAYRSITS